MLHRTLLIFLAMAAIILCQGCQTITPTTKAHNAADISEIAIPAIGISKQHHLSQTADGKLIASWVESNGSDNILRFAFYDRSGWQPVRTVVSTHSKLAASPVVLGLSDGALTAFWMQSVKDKKDPYAAEIFWSQSEDSGLTWSPPIKPYSAAAKIYDAQMSITPLPGTKLALVWTDSRHVNHDETKDTAHKISRYQLMAAILNKDSTINKEITLDNDVCSCCRAYTATAGNELMTVYRDHLKGEIRDISAVRWNPNGVINASPVHNDHWVINGCPSNGPAVAMSANKAAVAWFNQGKVQFGFADKTGAFQTPVVVDDHAIGYTNTVMLDDGSAMVGWRSNAGAEEKLLAARITPDGRIQDRTLIHSGSFPRWPSNYLAMQKVGNVVYVAWTDAASKKVRLAGLNP